MGRILAGRAGAHVLFCQGERQVAERRQEADPGAQANHGARDEGGGAGDQAPGGGGRSQGGEGETEDGDSHTRTHHTRKQKDASQIWAVMSRSCFYELIFSSPLFLIQKSYSFCKSTSFHFYKFVKKNTKNKF